MKRPSDYKKIIKLASIAIQESQRNAKKQETKRLIEKVNRYTQEDLNMKMNV